MSSTYDVVTFGRGIEHMDDVAAHLRGRLEDMAAILRLASGTATREDLERLDIDPYDAWDAGMAPDGFALEVKVGRWDDEERGLARVALLLTYGGPTVRLFVDYLGDEPYRVTLERFWGGDRDRAETEDHRALSVVDEFVRAFYVAE